MMPLPSPPPDYDPVNEAQTRRALELEIARLNADIGALRKALANSTTLPITIRG